MGIRGNFGPGTSLSTIIEFVRANINADRLTHDLAPLAQPSADADAGAAEEAAH
jgi:hypothetical protein